LEASCCIAEPKAAKRFLSLCAVEKPEGEIHAMTFQERPVSNAQFGVQIREMQVRTSELIHNSRL
jgi:hypothetical protein